MICPNCKGKIDYGISECPYCKEKIIYYFTIQKFLNDNFHLFAILGVIGTMISLLPNLANLLYGNNSVDWKTAIPPLQANLLVFSIASGGVFLSFLIILIISKLFHSRKKELKEFSICKFDFFIGDYERAMFLIFFLPFAMFSIYFVFYIFSSLTSVIILLIILCCELLLYVYIVVKSKLSRNKKILFGLFTFGLCALVILVSIFPDQLMIKPVNPTNNMTKSNNITLGISDSQLSISSSSILKNNSVFTIFHSNWSVTKKNFTSAHDVLFQKPNI